MGLYCTTTSLDTIMIGTNFDTATTALAGKKITQAENEINKYLSKRYDLSSSTFQTSTAIPPLVTSLCEQLSEGYMYQSMSRGSKESLARAKVLIDQVIGNLKLIADGGFDLVNTTGAVIPDSADSRFQVLCSTVDYVDTFDEGDELNWTPDSTKLSDIETARQ